MPVRTGAQELTRKETQHLVKELISSAWALEVLHEDLARRRAALQSVEGVLK